MNTVLKTSLAAISTIILAFIILSLANFSQLHNLDNNRLNETNVVDTELPNIEDPETLTQMSFLTQHFNDSENRIFIIGSSAVKPLNTTYIQDYLSKKNLSYKVYNLGVGADRPSDRIKTIDLIISAKPKVVVYGISYRDFASQTPGQSTVDKPKSLLPDPNIIFTDLLAKSGKSLNHILNVPENPKLMTLTMIKNTVNKISQHLWHEKSSAQESEFKPYPNALFNVSRSDTPKTDLELRSTFFREGASFNGIGSIDTNHDLIAFSQIINILHQNHIKVIVFTVPLSRYYLDDMPKEENHQFDLLLNKTSHDLNMQIYSLWDKYANLPIWYDAQHVAIYMNTPVYSEDISKIILKELEE